MQSVFVIITNELPLKNIFVKRFFVIILAAMVNRDMFKPFRSHRGLLG